MKTILLSCAMFAAAASGCGRARSVADGRGPTFGETSSAALSSLQEAFYDQRGLWHACVPDDCWTDNMDWGADSLTDAIYLRWKLGNDPVAGSMLAALNATGLTWAPCSLPGCQNWSDVPLWDSVTASRELEVTGASSALARAKAAFDMVDTSNAFALGACPSIDYQQPGGGIQLKTLETDSNYIKAAILLYDETQDTTYLTKATAKYAAVRNYFLDATDPLYTTFVFDDGTTCTQVPRRFFASVNGNMIWAGARLSHLAGDDSYLTQALATANAVVSNMADATGVFVDLQAECDVVEPLVEAMYELATTESQPFARTWLLTNAQASAASPSAHGLYGRFFNGPAPAATVTEWQANGALALSFVAAALEPDTAVGSDDTWATSTYVADDLSTFPSSITFTGRAIALYGTLGETCCGSGHARVFIDGTETFDGTGIWQNESNSGLSLPESTLFSWRWPESGTHTLQFQPGVTNPKEGGAFLHIQGYRFK